MNHHDELEGKLSDEHLNIHLQHHKLQQQQVVKTSQQKSYNIKQKQEEQRLYLKQNQQIHCKQEEQLQHTPSTCHIRKLHAEEYPLKTLIDCFLTAGHDGLDRCQFVLQDYSSGEIIVRLLYLEIFFVNYNCEIFSKEKKY